jgi:hypothetical protein
VVDLEIGQIVWVAEGKKAASLDEFFLEINLYAGLYAVKIYKN